MKRYIKSWYGFVFGIILFINFPYRVLYYFKTGSVVPGLFEPVYGQQAIVALGVEALLGLFGIYLIIIGIRGKKEKNNKGGKE